MSKPFKIKEIKKNIFLLEFKDSYDMCMYFLRYQEYYESSNPKFRGHAFKILDYMKWYSNSSVSRLEGAFTYPIDWSGFNIPDYVIKNVRNLGIPDENDYDKAMWDVYKHCSKSSKGEKFYIIGVTVDKYAGERDVLDHEVAHAMFYIDPKYKKASSTLVKIMDPVARKALEDYLGRVGYTPKVYVDEVQANMSTTRDWTNYSPRQKFTPEIAKTLNAAAEQFLVLFNEYKNK